MSPTTWHLEPDQIDAYTRAALTPAARASAEAHLEACPSCRAGVASAVSSGALATRLERNWAATADRLDTPRAGGLERLAATVGVPDHLARVIGASAGFRTAWLLATALAVGAGLALANGEVGPVAFLLLSPLVPVAGVAAVFGRRGAGSRAMETATPFGELRLMLLRTAAVTATSMVLLGAASLAVPTTGLEAVAWLLPALALTTTTLALATRFAPEQAALSVGVGWLLLIAVVTVELPPDARPTGAELGALGAPLQLTALALLITSTSVFLVRRRHVDLPTR